MRTDECRFYDGGLSATAEHPAEPPDPDAPPRIELRWRPGSGAEEFQMLRRLGYLDRRLGELLVPAEPGAFRTDLTSVPTLFAWLVPRTGRYLPAALLHDGLVSSGGEPAYVSTEGHVVDRVQADRVLRDAMADTGTGPVRRWLVWAAVATWTMVVGRGTGWSTACRWYYRSVALATIAVIAYLGAAATVDLLDVRLPGSPWLPWMGDRPWQVELAGGLAGSVVVPFALGWTWGRFRVAGWIVGIGIALLLHVTAALLVLTGLYRMAERIVVGWES